MRIALVNTNLIRPPIAPIGLDYLAQALVEAGFQVEILDLLWEEDRNLAISNFFGSKDFGLVGLTLRNTDDCVFSTRKSFLGDFVDIVKTIQKNTDALIAVGGVGFSTMPCQVLDLCEADLGIWGDGEFAFVELAKRIEKGKGWQDIPNLIWRDNDRWCKNPPFMFPLKELPPMRRGWVSNRRYFIEGGQGGIETKRGCTGKCIYCADPLAKGKRIRMRPKEAVIFEFRSLLDQGVDHIHICDSEFNLPYWHTFEICEEMIKNGLGDKLVWYTYCCPYPFSYELAKVMHLSGCVGINFGIDSGDERMLKMLGRNFTKEDILNAVHSCKKAKIAVMLDLLLGAPGESKESIVNTIELVKNTEADRIGVAVGVRVYPNTKLANIVFQNEFRDGLFGGKDKKEPIFFIEPRVSKFIFELLDELIGDDKRFFFFDPSNPCRNYNYDANKLLIDAIKEGYRGAYWDILRKYAEKNG